MNYKTEKLLPEDRDLELAKKLDTRKHFEQSLSDLEDPFRSILLEYKSCKRSLSEAEKIPIESILNQISEYIRKRS